MTSHLSIRNRVTLFVVLTLGVLTALMVIIQFRTSLGRVEDIERTQADADAERVARQLDASLADVGGTTSDWAWWTDSYEFVQDSNDDYRDNNLYAEAFTPIGIDVVAYLTPQGQVVHGARYLDGEEVAVPGRLLALGQPGGLLSDFQAETMRTPQGIVVADDTMYLVAGRAILPSDHSGAPAGVLLMARVVNDGYVAELMSLTGLDVHLEPCRGDLCQTSVGPLISATQSQITTTSTILGVDGEPAVSLTVTSPRTMYKESLAGIQRVLIILIGVGIGAVVITLAGLRRLIVDPLDRLGETVAAVANANDPSLRATVGRADEIGELAGAVNVMLARLELAQNQLLQANERIAGASEAKSRFLSHVSHELRTPINGVLAYAQLLQLDAPDDQTKDSLDQIVVAARHITQLVDEFLDIARIEAGSIPLAITSVRAGEIASEVISITQPLAAEKDTAVELLGDPQVFVEADPLRLRQVVLNLTSNAIKYGTGDRPLAIEIGTGPGRTIISVHDHGPGIPPDKIERLFVPFDRLDADGTGTKGTGLGLSVTKQLVELMDGTIDVASQPGRGTTFTVTLPAPALLDPDDHRPSQSTNTGVGRPT